MMPGTLKVFLDQCKESGMAWPEVEGKLKEAGWTDEAIGQANGYFTGGVSRPEASAPLVNNGEPIPVERPVENTPFNQPIVNKKRRSFVPFILFGLVGLMLVGMAGGAAAYMVATDKIPMANMALKETISDLVFSVPFVPKPAKYVLKMAGTAHSNLSRNSFDFSVAAKSNDLISMIGVDQMGTHVSGYTDFSDLANTRFSLNIEIGKEIAGQVVKNDEVVYFKVDTFPTSFLAGEGTTYESFLNKWISYDPTPQQSAAGESLAEMESQTDYGMNYVTLELLKQLMDEDIAPKIQMSNDEIDGFKTYKMVYAPGDSEVDRIGQKFSQDSEYKITDYVNNLKVTVWVDKKENFVRKAETTFDFKSSLAGGVFAFSPFMDVPLGKTQGSVAMVLSLSDFGKVMEIETPEEAVTVEELIAQFYQSASDQSFGAVAQNAKVYVELTEWAVKNYKTENGLYPTSISELEMEYLNDAIDRGSTAIIYKTNSEKDQYLIYASVPDLVNTLEPFIGVDSREGGIKNMSQKYIEEWQ